MRIAAFLFIITIFISANIKKESEKDESKELTTLEVMVIDATTEEPISAAKINIDKNSKEAYTNFDGFVKIENVSNGSHDIEISFISYEKQRLKAFQLSQSNNKLVVKLQP